MMSAVDEQDTASEPTGSLAYLAWPYLVELEKKQRQPAIFRTCEVAPVISESCQTSVRDA